jgi:hypothetical protein
MPVVLGRGRLRHRRCCLSNRRFRPPASSSLLDPQVAREFGIVAAHLLDEPHGVLAADEHLEFDAEREVGQGASSTTA